MNSSSSQELNRSFRLKTEIYIEETLAICFEKLELNKDDLIITSTFMLKEYQNSFMFHEVNILNVDDYGFGEPKDEWIDKILLKVNQTSYNRVIAIGGGAIIDISKLCIFKDHRNSKELFEDKLQLKKKCELIAIPTTCGTGSEVTSVSVVEFQHLNSKLGLQIDLLFPDKAILIEQLLVSLPFEVFATTSIDALVHAIESLLSPKANAYTSMYARSAIEGIITSFKECKIKGYSPQIMRGSLIYANMAGVAFSIAGCASVHALSFPLGANYNISHGEAIYMLFGSVLRYYKKLGLNLNKLEHILESVFDDKQDMISSLLKLLEDIMVCPTFDKFKITMDECRVMAKSVYENQQRLLVNSPITLSEKDLEEIYISCL